MPPSDVTDRPHLRRVWIVNQYAAAPDAPSGTRHFDLARQLVGRGVEVTIFAAGFSHVTGREERLGRRDLLRRQRYDGVDFAWVRTTPYRGNTWRRAVNMLSFALSFLVVQTRFRSPDVVVGSTVHPFAALAAWVAARLRGARFVFEIRDLWPQTLIDLGAMREAAPAARLLRAIEALLVRRASSVVTVLPGAADYLLHRGLPTHHVTYVPNGVDLAAFDVQALEDVSSGPAEAAALGAIDTMRRDGRVVFGYVGAFGRVNRVDLIADAALEAERQAPGRIGLVLVGDGPERQAVDRRADGSVVVAIPPVPKRRVPRLLSAFDATVVHATDNPVYRYGISFNKLFEGLAACRSVAFACRTAYDPVATASAGLTVEPDRVDLLAGALLAIADLPAPARAELGRRGRRFVAEHHDLAVLADTFAAALTDGSNAAGLSADDRARRAR